MNDYPPIRKSIRTCILESRAYEAALKAAADQAAAEIRRLRDKHLPIPRAMVANARRLRTAQLRHELQQAGRAA